MSRTPGRRTERPDDEPTLQVDELGLSDIGQRLIELGQQLSRAGARTTNKEIRRLTDLFNETGSSELGDDIDEMILEALSRTLSELREFRRSYDYWERVIAEYVLRAGFTQREVARLLGVSTATINRWAQNPVEVPIRS